MSTRSKKLETGTFRRPKASMANETTKPQQLEEYIYELENRNSEQARVQLTRLTSSNSNDVNRSRESTVPSPDIFTQLAQKEKDLILAAELGKALLERNEELTRANERITEEYSHKLEVSVSVMFLLNFIIKRHHMIKCFVSSSVAHF